MGEIRGITFFHYALMVFHISLIKKNMDYMKIDLSLFLGDSLLFSFSGYPTTDPFDRDMCTCFVKYQTFPNEFDLTQKMYVELSINDPNSLLDMAYNPRLLIKAGNWAHK